MRVSSLLLAFGLMGFTGLHATTLGAGTTSYSSMVIFGDSLSDSGNNNVVMGSQTQTVTDNSYIPTFPYAPSGTYCNGDVWASYAARSLGVSLQPSLLGGLNFAYGGATTGTTGAGGFPPSLLDQASLYLSTNTVSSTALYVIEGGGNDARAALGAIAASPGDYLQIIGATAASFASNVATIVTELQTGGAQHIIVWDTPNLGIAPAITSQGTNAATLGTVLATQMNSALSTALNGKSGVSVFSIYGLGTAIGGNPTAYGFTNATDACGAVAGANPSDYMFWDGIHPTTAAHSVIADAFVSQAVPEPSTYALICMGFIGMLMVIWKRKSV